jgi:hypothetical protein
VEQRVQIGVGLKDGVGTSRATVTAGIIADHSKMRYEDGKLLIPHSAIEVAAVYQYNRGPVTGRLVVESAAGNSDRSRIGTRCRQSKRARRRDATRGQRQEGDR